MGQAIIVRNYMSLAVMNLKQGQSTRWYVFLKLCPVQQLEIQRRFNQDGVQPRKYNKTRGGGKGVKLYTIVMEFTMLIEKPHTITVFHFSLLLKHYRNFRYNKSLFYETIQGHWKIFGILGPQTLNISSISPKLKKEYVIFDSFLTSLNFLLP